MPRIASVLALLLLAGCTASPSAPRVDQQKFSLGKAIVERDEALVRKLENQEKAKFQNNQGFEAIRTGDFERAKRHLQDALALDPGNAHAMMNMGVLLDRQEKPQEARDWYRKAFRANPDAVIHTGDQRVYGKGRGLMDILIGNWDAKGGVKEEALALKPNTANGRKVYETTCANRCHGNRGWGTEDGTYPQIAGQWGNVTIKQLADIREKNRDNPTMYKFALPSEVGGVQNIADVSAYIATLPMNPDNGKGPGSDLALGEKLYKSECAFCHGEKGEGKAVNHYPRLQGQHFNYLVRQFNWIKEGKRRNAHPVMELQVERFNEREVIATMDYVSRLKPPAQDLGKPGADPAQSPGKDASKDGDTLL
ncbi:MAG: c-type cytochrome [Magnetococcales bacterium]|nr:c-type cytochrome [Magnetococcales bacterium]